MMKFRTELVVKPLTAQIRMPHRIMLVGSCFTDHMSRRLAQHFFATLENPHGILFNPLSIAQALQEVITCKTYTESDLFFHNDLWQSWHHHSSFSHWEQSACLEGINKSTSAAHQFLKTANWLVVTLGSSFLYTLAQTDLGGQPGMVAANCHKVPASHFKHQLARYSQIEDALQQIVTDAFGFNPALQIIFTISPVRHSREGLVENNRSKALLHTGVHAMVQQHPQVHYFPAYELVIDDLRDYRFYAEDLVHPNHQATQYVWEKFCDAAIDTDTNALMKKLWTIQLAANHRPLHAGSPQHRQFLEKMLQDTLALAAAHPYLNFEAVLKNFSQQLNQP